MDFLLNNSSGDSWPFPLHFIDGIFFNNAVGSFWWTNNVDTCFFPYLFASLCSSPSCIFSLCTVSTVPHEIVLWCACWLESLKLTHPSLVFSYFKLKTPDVPHGFWYSVKLLALTSIESCSKFNLFWIVNVDIPKVCICPVLVKSHAVPCYSSGRMSCCLISLIDCTYITISYVSPLKGRRWVPST